MREHLRTVSGPGPWPGLPHEGSAPASDQEPSDPAAVPAITAAISDTRWLVLISGALLVADIAGASVTTAELLGRQSAVAVGSIVLLVPVLAGWLAAAALLIHAERPVVGALGELRRATGARVEPSAPWRSVGVRPLPACDLEWAHVVPLIAAATIQHARARLALCLAIITTAGLLLWMVLSLAIASVR
jgi:hypothetical protein